MLAPTNSPKNHREKYDCTVWRFRARTIEIKFQLAGKPCYSNHICCINVGTKVQDDSVNTSGFVAAGCCCSIL